MSLFPLSNPADPGLQKAAIPSVEFLEFLADWETAEGEWAGPAQFEDDSFDQVYDDSNEIEEDE